MDIRFQNGGAWKADIAVTFIFEGKKAEKACPEMTEAAPWLGIAPAWRDVTGKSKELTILYGHPDLDISRVMAAGLGKPEECKLKTLRDAAALAARACRDLGGAPSLGFDMASLDRVASALVLPRAEVAREAVIGAILGLYRYDAWRTRREDIKPDPRALSLLLTDRHLPDDVRDAVRLAEAEAAGICLARDLGNGPGNQVNPSYMAEQAEALAARHGMKCTVLGRAEMNELGMGSLLAVAKGSHQEPRFIVLEYSPKKECADAPLVLVGKGITFDSGGISLKPAAGMEAMKGDMAGAAAVMGAFETLGQLQGRCERPVVGIMPCTENMPGGGATRPGDIVTATNGKTIEINNTDAEGRLILADALAYAQSRWQPAAMVDIATLTGACVVALGNGVAGLFCNDEALCGRIVSASEGLGERLWRLPLWDHVDELLKSESADMVNVGPREGGALFAASFLQKFVNKPVPWAHLDIAGTDECKNLPTCHKGVMGFGVRTMVNLALQN